MTTDNECRHNPKVTTEAPNSINYALPLSFKCQYKSSELTLLTTFMTYPSFEPFGMYIFYSPAIEYLTLTFRPLLPRKSLANIQVDGLQILQFCRRSTV